MHPATPVGPNRCSGPARFPQCGLTLIELMVTIAILVVTMAAAVPQFAQWGRSTRVTTQATDIQTALTYARSESLSRGVRVTVCRSTDPRAARPACSALGTWADGWLIFVDNVQLAGNVAGVVDGVDTVLRIGDTATSSAITLAGNLGAWVAFTPQGLVRAPAGAASGSFRVCQSPYASRVSVNAVGLVSLTTETC